MLLHANAPTHRESLGSSPEIFYGLGSYLMMFKMQFAEINSIFFLSVDTVLCGSSALF